MVCVCKRASGLILQESEAMDSNASSKAVKFNFVTASGICILKAPKKTIKTTKPANDRVQMFDKKIELLKEFNLLEKPSTKHQVLMENNYLR